MRIARLLAAAVAAVLAAGVAGQAVSQEGVTVAIDVDVAGNDARTVGSVENCVRIDTSGTNELQLDVVLPPPGIPADVGIKAWQFDLLYDSSVVRVVEHNPQMLPAQAEGSELLTALSDETPESEGSFTSAGVDFGTPIGAEPAGVQEVGPGVIARITLAGVAKGTTDLTLSNVILVDANDGAIPLGNVLSAAVSVDTACNPPPSPTGGGTDGALPGTPGAGTPQPGTPGAGTPQPGTPGAETPTGEGVQTPGAGTPTLDGTPVSGGEPGGGGEQQGAEEEDGGLSAGAWAGIGVGIAAAVVAAAGASWYVMRRRRAGSE